MRILLLRIVLISSLFSAVYLTEEEEGVDEACSCDHCLKTNAEDDDDGSIPQNVLPLNKKETDLDDDSLQICARARDLPDRSFPSVCHMLCQNRCTRYNVTEIVEAKVKRYIATAYRTNYYKLRDGPCEKN